MRKFRGDVINSTDRKPKLFRDFKDSVKWPICKSEFFEPLMQNNMHHDALLRAVDEELLELFSAAPHTRRYSQLALALMGKKTI